ncbi:X8-like protein [Cynara cardunculus var. scolymus]|uniref:X8-like protein n=1 Tax=Cynara cardunculus var. scolymus TaxID=59895 RepID=A0A103XD56_CYNCS|nr:X8-like protein [Cynara cardunculus var. scolymus]
MVHGEKRPRRGRVADGINYAYGARADCLPIQESGPCFCPNIIQAHASYAFNSYYMRTSMVTGSCVFSGTATIAKTDPSYRSCVYPASPRSGGSSPRSVAPWKEKPQFFSIPTTDLEAGGASLSLSLFLNFVAIIVLFVEEIKLRTHMPNFGTASTSNHILINTPP